MSGVEAMFITCVVVFTALGALCDFRTHKLPNKLTVTSFLFALVFHGVLGATTAAWAGFGHAILQSLAGFAVGFGILFVLWLIGGGGGGDVKFMGALGAWLGPQQTVVVFFVSVVFVAIGTLMVLTHRFLRGGLARTKQSTVDNQTSKSRNHRRRLLPYGVPVALATWSVLIALQVASRS